MPKETMTITRDLFDEMLLSAIYRERYRILALLADIQSQDVHAATQGHCPCLDTVKGYING